MRRGAVLPATTLEATVLHCASFVSLKNELYGTPRTIASSSY